MVIIVVGILAVFVAPKFSALQGFDATGYRDTLRGALEFARKTAVAQRRNVQVTRSGSNLSFDVAKDTPEGAAPTTYNNPLTLPTTRSGCTSNTVCAPASVTLTAGPTTLVFSPLGRATAATYTYTVNGSSSMTVDAETGYVY